MILTWEIERMPGGTTFHYLRGFSPNHYICVQRCVPGDYSITAQHDDDCAGGEIETEPTLAKAKKVAERKALDGTWKNLTLEAYEKGQAQ